MQAKPDSIGPSYFVESIVVMKELSNVFDGVTEKALFLKVLDSLLWLLVKPKCTQSNRVNLAV